MPRCTALAGFLRPSEHRGRSTAEPVSPLPAPRRCCADVCRPPWATSCPQTRRHARTRSVRSALAPSAQADRAPHRKPRLRAVRRPASSGSSPQAPSLRTCRGTACPQPSTGPCTSSCPCSGSSARRRPVRRMYSCRSRLLTRGHPRLVVTSSDAELTVGQLVGTRCLPKRLPAEERGPRYVQLLKELREGEEVLTSHSFGPPRGLDWPDRAGHRSRAGIGLPKHLRAARPARVPPVVGRVVGCGWRWRAGVGVAGVGDPGCWVWPVPRRSGRECLARG